MPSSRGPEWPLIAAVAASIVLAIPLWCVAMPGMPDYPAHLASFHLIGGGASRYYTIVWDYLPNLASETLVPWLAKAMPLELAARLFQTVTLALWVLGPAAIQRALFGRVGASALVAAFFAYNANFMWGFFNYTFAVGLVFVVFAAWIATDKRRTLLHHAGFGVAVTAIYFSHLFALAVLLLAIGCFELSGWRAGEPRTVRTLFARALPVVLICLPAAFAFLVLKPAGADGGNLEFNLIGTMLDRIEAAIQFGFNRPATILTALLIVAYIAGLWTRRLMVHPRMGIALIAFAVGAVFAPEWALGGWGVHMRLPAVLGALAFASAEWNIPTRATAGLAAASLILICAGAFAVAIGWRFYDAQYSAFRAGAGDIKAGARLLTVLDGDSIGWDADQPYWHIAEFAIIDRGAFTPLMFTTAGQHVVRLRPEYAGLAASNARQGSPPDIDELDDLAAGRMDADEDFREVFPYLKFFQCHFDQAVVIHGSNPHARVPAMLRVRHDGGFYTLYDIVPDGHCGAR